MSHAIARWNRDHRDHWDRVIAESIVHTGQHFDNNMSDVFFEELGIPKPARHLGIAGGGHGSMTGRMLEALESVFMEAKPDLVLVYGDTNSTLAGALAAAKLHIYVAHVEAGLRSFNRSMPEELNRVLTDHASDVLIAPTTTAVANLLREGVAADRIHRLGDVMFDVALLYGERAERESLILGRLGVRPRSYLLATCHRAENTDHPERLRAIWDGLRSVATPDAPVVVPLHPRTRKALAELDLLGEERSQGMYVVEPVGYVDMVMLEKNARLIVTDSGGMQKEAFFHGVPCVTLRDETEWTELVELGWNRVTPPTSAGDVAAAIGQGLVSVPPAAVSPYGDGRAADRIAELLADCHYGQRVM